MMSEKCRVDDPDKSCSLLDKAIINVLKKPWKESMIIVYVYNIKNILV